MLSGTYANLSLEGDHKAVSFYEHFGFIQLSGQADRMLLLTAIPVKMNSGRKLTDR
jgi:hypothetical protein